MFCICSQIKPAALLYFTSCLIIPFLHEADILIWKLNSDMKTSKTNYINDYNYCAVIVLSVTLDRSV